MFFNRLSVLDTSWQSKNVFAHLGVDPGEGGGDISPKVEQI